MNKIVIDENSPFEDIARGLVFDYVVEHLDPTDGVNFRFDQIYVVLFTYVVGNWKALISTSLSDGMYYEVTFDKRRGLVYFDAYKRFDHKEIAIPIPGR
jgi:hypothetical protein